MHPKLRQQGAPGDEDRCRDSTSGEKRNPADDRTIRLPTREVLLQSEDGNGGTGVRPHAAHLRDGSVHASGQGESRNSVEAVLHGTQHLEDPEVRDSVGRESERGDCPPAVRSAACNAGRKELCRQRGFPTVSLATP